MVVFVDLSRNNVACLEFEVYVWSRSRVAEPYPCMKELVFRLHPCKMRFIAFEPPLTSPRRSAYIITNKRYIFNKLSLTY
jgi:hypothetical protein